MNEISYFPTQPSLATDNLKEGFEMGPPTPVQPSSSKPKPKPRVLPGIDLTEPNIWPDEAIYPHRGDLEKLYRELQSLSSALLRLLALALGKPTGYFEEYLTDSLSTLRLLHYPAVSSPNPSPNPNSSSNSNESSPPGETEVKLSCTPHTDSGILTLLHQDPTGGLEVRNADGEWVSAPYIPESLVVNIGDLMAKVSGGRFVATMHRVRAPQPQPQPTSGAGASAIGRLSVPFFFEPGEGCRVRAVDGDEEVVVYGEHVREKMKGFVEFKDL